MPRGRSQMVQNIVQAIAVAAALGLCSAAWSTYMQVHDLRGKVDWLYQYSFPEAK